MKTLSSIKILPNLLLFEIVIEEAFWKERLWICIDWRQGLLDITILSVYELHIPLFTIILDHSVPEIFSQSSSLEIIKGVPQTESDGKEYKLDRIWSVNNEETNWE